MADPVKRNEVPNEFYCAICLSIPTDPRIIGRCSHIFCEGCIQNCLAYKRVCPTCQHGCRTNNQVYVLKNKNPLAHRIWSNIVVKCNNVDRCGWTGSIEDYPSHMQSCTMVVGTETLRAQASEVSESVQQNHEMATKILEIKNLKAEIVTLQSKLEKKERKINRLLRQLSRQKRRKGGFFGFLQGSFIGDASDSSSSS